MNAILLQVMLWQVCGEQIRGFSVICIDGFWRGRVVLACGTVVELRCD